MSLNIEELHKLLYNIKSIDVHDLDYLLFRVCNKEYYTVDELIKLINEN